MVLSACGAHAVKVAAFGYEDKTDPDIFGKGMNYWDNPFSNSSMLLKLSNGGIARISENRRIAGAFPRNVYFKLPRNQRLLRVLIDAPLVRCNERKGLGFL